jgi:hypothetical protein
LSNEAKLDILMREYETLRAEILERLKLAFQQLGWAGAVIAFAIPLAASDFSSASTAWVSWLKVGFAVFGVLLLVWLSVLNWLWLGNCADQLRRIEEQVGKHTGIPGILTWERRASQLTRWTLLPPKRPDKVTSPVPDLPRQTGPDRLPESLPQKREDEASAKPQEGEKPASAGASPSHTP